MQNHDAALASDEFRATGRTLRHQIVRLLPTAVCAEWIKSSYERGIGPPYPSLEELRTEAIAYLVPWGDGDKEAALAFVEKHCAHLLRRELMMRETVRTHWPPLSVASGDTLEAIARQQ